MLTVGYLVTCAAAYLLGSLPTGFLVAKAHGIDIRAVGSGNIGATNVFRTLGKPAGVFVLLVDAAKGFIACGPLAAFLARRFGCDPGLAATTAETFAVLGGVAAILGHNYTCWLGFRGGKGVATTAGVLVGLFPKAFWLCLAVWGAVFAASRYVSLASLAAAVALPAAVALCGGSRLLTSVAALLGALAIYKHKGNIQRLRNGTESRFGRSKPPSP